jgi:beta-glucosidase
MTADPRLLAHFDADAGQWRIDEGSYQVAVGHAANVLDQTAETTLTGAVFGG